MPLILYAHPFSSYCQKALIAFYENDVPFELRMLSPEHEANQAAFAELWPIKRFPLLVEGDRPVPEATVIWAHAGAYPYPPLLRDYLQRYPGLYMDLSVRDQRVAPDGQLDPQWELLLLEYSERFMVGVDTYSTERWHAFAEVVSQIRNWLDQLPDEVSGAIAYRNAARLFGHSIDN